MSTSGTYTFGVNTEWIDLITEAYERCGKDGSELPGNWLESARRSANAMFVEWSNRGPNLFAVEEVRLRLETDVNTYTLPAKTVYLLQVVVRREVDNGYNQDLVLGAISRNEWAAQPNKLFPGIRPTQFYFNRTQPPTITLWPVQDNADNTLIYWVMNMVQDVGAMTDIPAIANRWTEALTSGIAARLAVKWAPDRLEVLAKLAAEQYGYASAEDRERVPLRITPSMEYT